MNRLLNFLQFTLNALIPAVRLYYTVRPIVSSIRSEEEDEPEEEEESLEEQNSREPLIWGAVGISVGLLAGILFAPQEGEQTRQALTGKTED